MTPDKVQDRLRSILAYTETANPNKGKVVADLHQLLTEVSGVKTAGEEPDLRVRREAYEVAKTLMKDDTLGLGKDAKAAAKAYFDAMYKSGTESERFELAQELIKELEFNRTAAENTIKVLTQKIRVFEAAAADHNRLAYFEG